MTKVGTIVKIREYRDKGLTKKATAQHLGLDRKTVAKYWEGSVNEPERPRYEQRFKLTDLRSLSFAQILYSYISICKCRVPSRNNLLGERKESSLPS